MRLIQTAGRLVAVAGALAALSISVPAVAQLATPGVYDVAFGLDAGAGSPGHSGTAALWVGADGVVAYATGTVDGSAVGIGPVNGFGGNDNLLLAGPALTFNGIDLVTGATGNTFNLFSSSGYNSLYVSGDVPNATDLPLTSFSLTREPGTIYNFSFLFNSSLNNPNSYDASGTFLVNNGLITAAYGTINGQSLELGAIGGFGGNDNVFLPGSPFLTTNGVNFTVPATGNTFNIFVAGGVAELYDSLDRDAFRPDEPLASLKITEVGAAVPEPSTWAMMLVGFGAIGLAVRAKKRPLTAAI